MILNVSGRTDIVAFYTDWFFNRINEGFFDVRNPFNPKLISRINYKDVDAIMFCTKNPIPIVDRLKDINKQIVFHTTITPYKKDIEPNVVNKSDIINAVKKISDIIGINNTIVRYDPIFINKTYTLEYHIKAFDKLCTLLDGYINKIIVSFLDNYKNVQNNVYFLRPKTLTEKEYEIIGKNFSGIAKKHNITVQTCAEKNNLVEYGFAKGECMSKEMAYLLTGKKYSKWKARNKDTCNCIEMVDIGFYNTCNHLCKYCYANYNETKVKDNIKLHDKNSSLLIGQINKDDIIKIRK